MKGIFFSEGLKMNLSNTLGIERKVSYQVESLASFSDIEHINIDIDDLTLFDKMLFMLPVVKSKREKRRKILLNKVDNTINYIYIRKPSLTINFYKILLMIKKKYKNIKILMEIPTYPFHSEYRGINKLAGLKSTICEKKLYKVVDYIITYSDDKTIWGIPCINTSNCVKYSMIKPRSNNYCLEKNNIRLTCVTNFIYWHGNDRLINGIKEYNGKYKITLNLVGNGPEIDNLKKMSNESVVFWGAKNSDELNEIFDRTDIAIDALGRHRSGVYYNSSLKGKEYCARGVPIVSGVKTELDCWDNYPYYLKVPADDSNIVIEDIIDFYEKIYLDKDISSITEEIRNLTMKSFDYKYGFENVIKELVCKR